MSDKFKKQIEFKTIDDEKGKVEAVFSVFNNIDTDGDVVLPGSIKSGFKDNQVPMVFAHKWDQPIGKGVIESDNEKATFRGSFFMETEAGREAYLLAKEMGDLQEWSFGFRINDYESGKFKKDGEETEYDVRFLKDLEVYEVSPVLVGANRETYTLAIKSGEDAVYEASNIEEKAEVLPEVFDTAEEAEARAKELGCEGSHEYDVDGKTFYMPCKSHEDFEAAMGEDENQDEDSKSGGCCNCNCSTEESDEKGYGKCDYNESGKCAKESAKDSEEDLSEKESSLQGVRFSDEVKDVLAALESLIVRAKAISILREKDGRTISENASSALRAVQEDLNDAWNEIDSILGEASDTPSEPEEDTEDVPVDEAPVEEIQEDAEIAEAEAEVSTEEEDVTVEEESDEEEVEEEIDIEVVDEEFDALFAEAQQNITDSILVELDDEEV